MSCDFCGEKTGNQELCKSCIQYIEGLENLGHETDLNEHVDDFLIELGMDEFLSEKLDIDFRCAIGEELYFQKPTYENLSKIFHMAMKSYLDKPTMDDISLHFPSELYLAIHARMLAIEDKTERVNQLQNLSKAAEALIIHPSAISISEINESDGPLSEFFEMKPGQWADYPALFRENLSFLLKLRESVHKHFTNRDQYSSRILFYAHQVSKKLDRVYKNNRNSNNPLPSQLIDLCREFRKMGPACFDLFTGHPTTYRFSKTEKRELEPIPDKDPFWDRDTRIGWIG